MSDDGHWLCSGFTEATVPATGLRAVGLTFSPLARSRLQSSWRGCRRILCARKVECVGSSGLELLQPLWFTTRRNKWVSLDPGSVVLIKTCFQTPESRCAPVEWYPQRRSFSSDF